jgi:hypothetical protein
VIYELVAGKHPYRGETAALTMSAILTKPYPPLTGSHIPKAPGLNAILSKALALDPAARYATAADLLVDLQRAQHGGALPADHPRPPSIARSRRAIVLSLLVAAVAIGAAVPIWNRWRQPTTAVTAPKPDGVVVPASAAPARNRTITYWLDVRPNAGSGASHRSLGDEPIGPDARVRLNVVASNPGLLYLVDQEGDEAEAPLALVYPVSSDPARPTNGDATGWYGFAGASGTDRLWLIWSAAPVAQLDALRPLVNDRDLGRVRDPAQANAIRGWLRDAAARDAGEARDAQPVQMTVAYGGDLVVRRIVLHQAERTSR